MHFTGFENDSRRRCVGHLAGLPDQGVELVDSQKVAKRVDGHVPVDARCSEPDRNWIIRSAQGMIDCATDSPELVGVDTRAQDEDVQSCLLGGKSCEDFLGLLEVSQVDPSPRDVRNGKALLLALVLDVFDGTIALVLFAVHHDDSCAVLPEEKKATVNSC